MSYRELDASLDLASRRRLARAPLFGGCFDRDLERGDVPTWTELADRVEQLRREDLFAIAPRPSAETLIRKAVADVRREARERARLMEPPK